MKLIYQLGAYGLLIAVCLFSIGAYGKAKYREGRLEAIQAQTNTDNQALIAQAQTMVDAFSQTQNALKELYKTPDPVTAPRSVVSTINSLCDRRKANNVPCSPAKPSQ